MTAATKKNVQPNVKHLNADKEQVFFASFGIESINGDYRQVSYSRIIIRGLKEISFAPTPINLDLLFSLWSTTRLTNTGLSKF